MSKCNRSVTVIKADPGCFVVRAFLEHPNEEAPYLETFSAPVIAWEIVRVEGPDLKPHGVHTLVIAIARNGWRGGGSCYDDKHEGWFEPVAVKYSDGSYFDGDETYDNEASMLEAWNRIKAEEIKKRIAERERHIEKAAASK